MDKRVHVNICQMLFSVMEQKITKSRRLACTPRKISNAHLSKEEVKIRNRVISTQQFSNKLTCHKKASHRHKKGLKGQRKVETGI